MALTRVDLGGLTIDAVSIGGLRTSYDLPSYKVAVDLGSSDESLTRRSVVFLTHAHVDHIGSLTHHVAQRALQRLPAPRYYVPRPIAAEFEAFLDSLRALQRNQLPAEVVGIEPGEEVQLARHLYCRPFAMDHRVPAHGYAFVRRSFKLNPDLAGQPGQVIAARRRAGDDVDVPVDDIELAIGGDGTLEGILESSDALGARRLAVEVTFVDDRVDAENAHSKGHTHVDDLVQHADAFTHEAILLTHLSSRYTMDEALEGLRQRLPAELAERCQVLHADGVARVG